MKYRLLNITKPLITLIILLLGPSSVFGQFGIDYNQSNLPFIEVSYDDRDVRSTVRFGESINEANAAWRFQVVVEL